MLFRSNSSFGIVDNKTELEPEDDAATVNWGEGWQMPSRDQFSELVEKNSSYTTTEWTTLNGVNGLKITSKSNGNSIFMPAVGIRDAASLFGAGNGGGYWSRTLTNAPNSASGLNINSSDIGTGIARRYYGFCVRPVRK